MFGNFACVTVECNLGHGFVCLKAKDLGVNSILLLFAIDFDSAMQAFIQKSFLVDQVIEFQYRHCLHTNQSSFVLSC